jgi:hypothetical protein
VKYRVNDLDLFTHGILRDIVRNSLNEVASTYVVEDIYGEKKAEFLGKVESQIQERSRTSAWESSSSASSARRAFPG